MDTFGKDYFWHGGGPPPCSIYRYRISIVDISTLLKNIDIGIDNDKAFLKNIGIDIDKEILENINIDKISNQLEFGISNRAKALRGRCKKKRKTN